MASRWGGTEIFSAGRSRCARQTEGHPSRTAKILDSGRKATFKFIRLQ